jgi:hypothetical protein
MNIIKHIENNIITVKNQLVMIDADLAELYEVETRDINKAVKNNPEKFPKGYFVELTKDEKNELVENFHRFNKLKHSTVEPKAFTEKGLYMLATILKSPVATQTTLAIIETFSKIRELGRNVQLLSNENNDEVKKPLLQKSGELIAEILDDDLNISETETTVEINFAVLKFKHTIKRDKK